MTLGRREYTEGDMMRMQRDAEERVREMQSRARVTVEEDTHLNMPSRNRNWNSGPGMRRPNRRQQPEPPAQPKHPPGETQPEQEAEPARESQPPPRSETEPKNKTTIVEDIMGALSLDEDYLLIIGLILILVNQRADTTLILALAYLLI